MPSITGHDLIAAGWESDALIGKALERAAEYEAKGVSDPKYLLKLLRRDFPAPDPLLSMRRQAAPLAEAIAATCEEDERNIGNVRRTMGELLRVPVIERGAVMPDACPAGSAPATIPVGGAIAVDNAIIPSAHSADICCSMFATFFTAERATPELLDAVMAATRFGPGGRPVDDNVHHPVLDEDVWDNKFLKGLERHAAMHMADQGDGNHFAYLGRVRIEPEALNALDAAGHTDVAETLRAAGADGQRFESLALVTHHGSRGLGAQVYKRGQNAALKQTAKVARDIPKPAAWIDYATEEGKEYWQALEYVGRWTRANHESIHARFLANADATRLWDFGNEHNFVWKRGDRFLHGKGATPAWNDDEGRPLLGLIPLNMASPILMVLGRDNDDYLSFCPHGAGRNRSRTATIKPFRNKDGSLDEQRIAESIAETTAGLDIRWWHGKPDLSESPIGYKSAAQVKAQITEFGLADVLAEIAPLGCIMAGDGGAPPWMRRKEELSPKQIRQIGHRAERRKTRQRLDEDWEG